MVKLYLVVGIVSLGILVTYFVIRKRKGYTTKYAPAYSDDQTQQEASLGAPIPRSMSYTIENPVLDYQRRVGTGTDPATFRDPIRGPNVSGPIFKNKQTDRYIENDTDINFGPYPGKPMGVPVPAGALKETNEKYYGWASQRRNAANNLNFFMEGVRSLFGYSLGMPAYPSQIPFYGNVNENAPFPAINPSRNEGWEKVGILTLKDSNSKTQTIILNLYSRPIAPTQNLWEYQVEDADGFIIKLADTYIEDGDTIRHIIGKPGVWIAHIFTQNKYIWV